MKEKVLEKLIGDLKSQSQDPNTTEPKRVYLEEKLYVLQQFLKDSLSKRN